MSSISFLDNSLFRSFSGFGHQYAVERLQLRNIHQNGHRIERRAWHMLNNVPRSIDQEVAGRILSSWGCGIDTLTPEQRKYLYGE